MGTGPAGRDIFTVGVVTRRSGYSYGIMKHHTCIYFLVYYENPYWHLLQNWPLFARVFTGHVSKTGLFSNSIFRLPYGQTVSYPRRGRSRRADPAVGATCRRGDELSAEL